LEVWKRETSGTWKLVEKAAWGKGRPARSVFKRLLAAPGRRLSRGTIQDDLWPDSENFELADKNIYNAISVLHRVVGKQLVKTCEAAYELAGQDLIWTDSDACEELLKAAENQGCTSIRAHPLLEQALGYLERGEFLEGESGVWVYRLRKKSEDLLRQCRVWLAESYEAQAKLLQAGLQYRAMLQQMPPDEEALQSWIQMLARHGKRQEALKCYRDVKNFVEAQGFSLSNELEQFAARLEEQSLQESASHSPLVQRSGNTQHSLTLPIWTDINLLSSIPITTTMSSEQLLALGEPLPISKETLHLFSALTETCRHLSEGNELRVAEQILWTYLPKVELLAQFPSEHREMAAGIASQGYLLAASLVGHRNDFHARRYFSEQALLYGEIAQDDTLQVAAFRQLAATFNYLGLPHKVMETYQHALSRIDNVPPLLRSCIYAALSGVCAQLRQKEDTDYFIGLAYENFGEHQGDETDFLRAINASQNLLIHWDGKNHLQFGRPHAAEKIFLRLDVLDPNVKLPKRIRIEAINNRAKMFIAVGNMEQACMYLESAVKIAVEIGSSLRLQEVAATFQSLKDTWPYEKRVQESGDLFIQYLINHIR
jgi:DNA-binding SARP family transcriptional activator